MVLKGNLAGSLKGINLRKALVIFQFTVGLFLIIATITVFNQISFMRNQNLGFAKDQTLVIRAPRVRDAEYGAKFDAFKATLLQRTEIDKISHVTEVPGRQIYWDAGGIFKAEDDVTQSKNYQIIGVDYDFADLFELEFAAGRNFSRDFPADKDALILNETAVKQLGFDDSESAVGKEVNYWGQLYPVIGVLKDYHQQSLKVAYEPHIFRFVPHGRGPTGMISIALNGSNIKETVELIGKQYDEFFPGNPYNYFFLDDYFDQQYPSDELFGRVYGLFSLLAIIITALGIYGLSSYSIVQLTKQIAIRKVLGASVIGIMRLLTREFMILLVISYAIAWPIGYLGMKQWLENFAYRTDIGGEIFILAGI